MNSTDTGEKKPPAVGGVNLVITLNPAPFQSFTKILQCFIESGNAVINGGDLPLEVARVETDAYAAGTGELRVTLYPSDAFLRYAATLFAGNGDQLVVK